MKRRMLFAPAIEPVSLAELKAHFRIDHTQEDNTLLATLVVARMSVERLAQRALINQTVRLFLDALPEDGVVRLAVSPVQSVVGARVWTSANTATPVPPEAYRLDASGDPPRLVFSGSVPTPYTAVCGIEIDLVIGYGSTAESVPAPLRQAVKMLTARWYETRGDGPEASDIPDGVRSIIDQFRPRRLVA